MKGQALVHKVKHKALKRKLKKMLPVVYHFNVQPLWDAAASGTADT